MTDTGTGPTDKEMAEMCNCTQDVCRTIRPTVFTHGRAGYTFHRCRCEVCKQAQLEYAREYARRNRDRLNMQRRRRRHREESA
jgi:hypothetical protein